MNDKPESSKGQDQNGWQCSDKQREFIERIVRENSLDKTEVEALAVELFGHGVKSLNRLAASGFIDQLLERHGGKRNGNRGRLPAGASADLSGLGGQPGQLQFAHPQLPAFAVCAGL